MDFNYWFYDVDASSFHIFFYYLDISISLVPFEFLRHYLNTDSSNLLREAVQWIKEKVFREQLMIYMASIFSSRTFLLNFWFLPLFVVVFIAIRLIRKPC